MNNIRGIVLIGLGLVIGLLSYNRLAVFIHGEKGGGGTFLVDSAVANTLSTHDQIRQNISESRQNAITRAVAEISPAVVSVNVTKIREYIQRNPYSADPFFRRFFPELFRDRRIQQQVPSLGSGFLISGDGYVVTNEHVVEDATEIVISFSDGREYAAKQIGNDRISDIALLKIEGKDFPFVKFGNSDELLIGEWAIAFGNPFGLFVRRDPTVTVGVISAVDRDFGLIDNRVYQDMIQTDASINKGNSGGPLCNAAGELVGMNTFIYTVNQFEEGSVGIGFAIPVRRIRQITDELKSNTIVDRDFWLGVSYDNLNRYIARQLGYESLDGVYVGRIDLDSPAEKAGMKLGDIIVEINGIPVKDVEEVRDVVYSSYPKVGDILKFRVWRGDRFENMSIKLEKNRSTR